MPDAIIQQYIKNGFNEDKIYSMIEEYIQKFDDENDGKFSFHDAVYCSIQAESTYKHIMEKNSHKIWIRPEEKEKENEAGYYFINDIGSQICSNSSYINEIIENNILLSPQFKKKHFRIIKIKPSIFQPFISLMEEEKESVVNCIQRMSIMKNIANAIFSCGDLDFAALTLYKTATRQGGADPDRKHIHCHNKKQQEEHDALLSKLYNNISTIYYKHSQYESSKCNALEALKLNPNYTKCIDRLALINDANHDPQNDFIF